MVYLRKNPENISVEKTKNNNKNQKNFAEPRY